MKRPLSPPRECGRERQWAVGSEWWGGLKHSRRDSRGSGRYCASAIISISRDDLDLPAPCRLSWTWSFNPPLAKTKGRHETHPIVRSSTLISMAAVRVPVYQRDILRAARGGYDPPSRCESEYRASPIRYLHKVPDAMRCDER